MNSPSPPPPPSPLRPPSHRTPQKAGRISNNPGNKGQKRHPEVAHRGEHPHRDPLVVVDAGEEGHLGDHDDTGHGPEYEEPGRVISLLRRQVQPDAGSGLWRTDAFFDSLPSLAGCPEGYPHPHFSAEKSCGMTMILWLRFPVEPDRTVIAHGIAPGRDDRYPDPSTTNATYQPSGARCVIMALSGKVSEGYARRSGLASWTSRIAVFSSGRPRFPYVSHHALTSLLFGLK